MTCRASLVIAVGVFALALGVSPASAQTMSKGDIGLGFSFVRLFDEGGDLNLPTGWLVSFAQPVKRLPLAIVGEGAGNYKSEDGETLRVHTAQAGVRVFGRAGAATPFAQFLVGVMNAGCCGASLNFLAIEPGGGVDVRVAQRLKLRVGVSFPTAFDDGETGNAFRFQAGVVLPF